MSDIIPLVTIEDYQGALETTLCTLESLLCTGGHEPHAQTLADADQWLDTCRRALDEAKRRTP